MRRIFLFKMLKICCRLQENNEIFRKTFGFLDNIIWIVCQKFSVQWQEYFKSAVNVLTNTLNTSHLANGDIFHQNSSQNEKRDKRAFVQISGVFWTPERYYERVCSQNLKKSINFEILKRWGSSFWKCSKNYCKFQKCNEIFSKNFWFLG